MILIVDDNRENIYSLQTLLVINGFKVDVAFSGEEALKKILKNYYALIILDVQMPDMDGFEVAEAISGYSKSKDIPIIFLSAASTTKRFITKGYASGGIDYVTKPFDPDILLLKIKTFYKLSEQTRQLNLMDKHLREEIEFRKRAENSLQAYVTELRSILESIPQIAFTIQADGTVEFVNQHWYAYSNDLQVFPEAEGESIQDGIRLALATQDQVVREICIRKLNATTYRFHVLHLTPVMKGSELTKWVGMLTDIHDQKMASQLLEKRVEERTIELRKMNQRLEDSNHELQQFAFVASHDLQEPLRKIQTFSNIVLDKYLPGETKAKPYLTKITSSAERLRKLINDLLNYSRVNAEDQFELTDMNAIIREVLSDLELKVRSVNAEVHIDDLPRMEVIPAQIRQLFQNLLSNALKFSREGVRCVIRIQAACVDALSADASPSPGGAFCRISVHDNGIGFDEAFTERIFEIFQRLNPRDIYEGTGIGLAIVKKVIDRHHGIIAARSREQEGSTFVMVLPVRQSQSFYTRDVVHEQNREQTDVDKFHST